MHLKKTLATIALLTVADVSGSACGFQMPSGPSPTISMASDQCTPQLLGTWTAQFAPADTRTGCSDFLWTVTSQTSTEISGQFSATCLGVIPLSGTATGHLDAANSVALTVTGSGNVPSTGPC